MLPIIAMFFVGFVMGTLLLIAIGMACVQAWEGAGVLGVLGVILTLLFIASTIYLANVCPVIRECL